MKTCNRAYEPIVRDIVSRELGSQELRLTAIPTYPDTVVYEATSKDRSIVFKGIDPAGADPDGIALEAWALETAGHHGVPVPAVHLVDLSKALYPGSFFVMEKVKGNRLDEIPRSSGVDVERIVIELGSAIRRLHEVELPGFGWLDEEAYRRSGVVRGSFASWWLALSADIPAALEHLSQTGLDPTRSDALRLLVDTVVERIPNVADGVLLHGDFGQTHVYVDPERSTITGLVDFGERSSGDWVWDLCEWEEPGSLRVLLSGYGLPRDEFRDVELRLDDYLLIKAVPWASKWYQRGEPQVIDWLHTVMTRIASRGSA